MKKELAEKFAVVLENGIASTATEAFCSSSNRSFKN